MSTSLSLAKQRKWETPIDIVLYQRPPANRVFHPITVDQIGWYSRRPACPVHSRKEEAMQTQTLSEPALTLLHRRLAGERVEVTDETRPLYRELVDSGMMMPLHTFALGLHRLPAH